MGSFETDVHIPDLRKSPLKMSSVVLSSLRVPSAGKKAAGNPLVRDQMELVPNITHVFTPDQHLYLQYEVYDAAKGRGPVQVAPAPTLPRQKLRNRLNLQSLRVIPSASSPA